MAALDAVSKTTREGAVGLPPLFCDGMSLVGPSPNLLHHHRCSLGLDEPESEDVANVTDRATAACGACSDVDDLKAPDEDMVLVLQCCSVIVKGTERSLKIPKCTHCLTAHAFFDWITNRL